MDDKIRQLERQWRASGSNEDAEILFSALRRAGQLTPEWYRELREKPTYNLTDSEFCNKLSGNELDGRANSYFGELFTDKIQTLAVESSGDYQGTLYAILKINSDLGFPTYALWSDYYGSCSGCDSLMSYTTIAQVQDHMEGTLRNVRQFWTMNDLVSFLNDGKDAGEYVWNSTPTDMITTALRTEGYTESDINQLTAKLKSES